MFNKKTNIEAEGIKIANLITDHQREINKIKEDHEYSLRRLTQKYEDDINRIETNQDTIIANQVNNFKIQETEDKIKIQTQAKEIDILNKAFTNLGFDVKDMKEILNKLVDGLITKNEIKLVK